MGAAAARRGAEQCDAGGNVINAPLVTDMPPSGDTTPRLQLGAPRLIWYGPRRSMP